ncbi:MAG: Clp1/GlmU family protein [Candidatus Asgardarchaeum sp.]
MKITVNEKHTMIVEGEATIKIVDGEVEIFGSRFSKGEVIYVPYAKALPLYVLKKLSAEALFSEGGKIREVDENTIPNDWDSVFEEINLLIKNSKNIPVVLFIGDVDTGKTTLITYVMNKLSQSGYNIAVIDADTGQSDVGPPTTIGLGLLRKGKVVYSLKDVEFIDAFFLGLTSPAGLLHRSITGVQLMVEKAKKLDTNAILIDTTGWVYDHNARDLKLLKVLSVKPDLIVLIEKENELEYYYKMFHKFFKILRVTASRYVRARDREERRMLRQKMYAYFLLNAKEIEIDLEQTSALYSFLWTGSEVNNEDAINLISSTLSIEVNKILYVEETTDCIIVITERGTFIPIDKVDKLKDVFAKREVKVISRDVFDNLLVAFLDSNFSFLGIGTILDVDFKKRKLKVYSNVNPNNVSALMFGYIRISPEGEELGWTGHWPF